MTDRATILVLVDEIKKAGLPVRTRALIEALRRHVETVVVARCYLHKSHRARRRLLSPQELYGFMAEDYDAQVAGFASRLEATHRPRWALSHGWENPRLALELDRLGIPIICYLDAPPTNLVDEDRLHAIIRCSEVIALRDDTIAAALTTARRTLDARAYQTLLLPASGKALGHRPYRWRFPLGRSYVRLVPDAAPIADALHGAGTCAAAEVENAAAAFNRDRGSIRSTGLFNATLSETPVAGSSDAALTDYLRASRRAIPRDRPLAGRLLRRPVEGFNPLVYATEAPDFDEAIGEEPLAHFIRNGQPDGRWRHAVIRPDPTAEPYTNGSVAIHAHFHYPGLLPELIDRLGINRSATRLFVTTTSAESRSDIECSLADARLDAQVTICENRGRDLWPFLDLLQRGTFDACAVVGHVHGKRSPSYVAGHTWRDFLWSHLIGGDDRMMDAVLGRFEKDETLGLVFAEDPHLDGWEANFTLATDLAARAGLYLPLPNHFDYPMGSMFWARPAALIALRTLHLTRDMMPEEPLPDDGTILHAIERLVPFFVAKAGYRYATTHVPGSTR